jgi:hypothetical protein
MFNKIVESAIYLFFKNCWHFLDFKTQIIRIEFYFFWVHSFEHIMPIYKFHYKKEIVPQMQIVILACYVVGWMSSVQRIAEKIINK